MRRIVAECCRFGDAAPRNHAPVLRLRLLPNVLGSARSGRARMVFRTPARVVSALLLFAASASAQPVAGPAKAKATTPEIPFESVANFFKMPPGIYMGEGVGVATNSKGHVFVYSRSGETRLFEFDQNGAFVKEFGVASYGFSFAHAVRV